MYVYIYVCIYIYTYIYMTTVTICIYVPDSLLRQQLRASVANEGPSGNYLPQY